MINNLSCIEEKGGGKDILCSAQNAALFIDLLYVQECLLLRFYIALWKENEKCQGDADDIIMKGIRSLLCVNINLG